MTWLHRPNGGVTADPGSCTLGRILHRVPLRVPRNPLLWFQLHLYMLVLTTILVLVPAVIMGFMGHRRASRVATYSWRETVRAVLWSIPLCWTFLIVGGGHGGFPLALPSLLGFPARWFFGTGVAFQAPSPLLSPLVPILCYCGFALLARRKRVRRLAMGGEPAG